MKLLRINARIPQPRISQSKSDPVGAAMRLNKIDRKIKARYAALKVSVTDLFNAIPRNAVNADSTAVAAGVYHYDFSAARAASFLDDLQRAIDNGIMDGAPQGQMWAGLDVQDAYQAGAVTAHSQLSNLSSMYAESRPIAAILYSSPYIERLQIAYTQTYSDWRGLSDTARSDLASTIMEAIARGDNPRNVAGRISERLDVSMSRARSMAQTEVTGALRLANRREVVEARELLGLDTVMLWTSALMATTRATHAARHGKYYTPEEIDEFYSVNGNKRNCHCAQTPALIMDGKPAILESTQERLDKQRDTWEEDREKAA